MIYAGPIELSGSEALLFMLVVLGVPAIALAIVALFAWVIASEVRQRRRSQHE
jgi:hypothetical protein